MKAAPDKVVKVSYEMRNEPNGEVMDSAPKDAPFAFLFGYGNVLEMFEKNLEGMIASNQFHFVLSAEDAYGEYDEEAVILLGKEVFEVDGKPQDDMLFVGNTIPLQDEKGNPFQGEIVEINERGVVVDLNHPFAGEELHFDGEIIEVRDANPEELAHGHVHEGGHHHH